MALAKTYLTVNGKIRSEQRAGEAHSRDYVLDRLGSVIQIYQNGWPIADACYEPYGGIYTQWNMSGKTFTWLGGWGYHKTGVEWSSVYVRARHYSRGLSNWTSVDPLWPAEMPYGYVDNRVMTGVDYWGMQSCPHHHDYGSDCRFSGPPGSERDPAYWHCLETILSKPLQDPYGFWKKGFWEYGNCCGPNAKCGLTSKTYNCTDAACKSHDTCVRATILRGAANWLPCNKKFCNDIKYCWNRSCVGNKVDKKQCAAIQDIAKAFCNVFGGSPSSLGKRWGITNGGGLR